MSPPQLQFLPIARFPKPWAHQLPEYLGSVSFAMESSSVRQLPNQFLGVLSSHQHKHGDAFESWWRSLESALSLANQQGWGVLCAGDAPYSRSVIHACRRLGIPRVELQTCPTSEILCDNFVPIQDQDSGLVGRIWIATAIKNDRFTSRLSPLPLRDLAVAFLADRAFALQVRKGGKIRQLLQLRLACSELPSASTYVSIPGSVGASKVPQKSRSTIASEIDLLNEGAVGWFSKPAGANPSPNVYRVEKASEYTHQPIASINCWRRSFDRYLVHCTRARIGPWPDQSDDQYHDELLQRPWQLPPTPLETLTRILSQQRLLATKTCRRGSNATVCFSSQPLDHLLSLRRYQSHLGRWDWEPYGLMIDREWLTERGAKQVHYVTESQAKQLNVEDLTFAQVVNTTSHSIDWTVEKEWRLRNDVRLSHIPADKAVVFVKTPAEARSIQHLSRWPIGFTT